MSDSNEQSKPDDRPGTARGGRRPTGRDQAAGRGREERGRSAGQSARGRRSSQGGARSSGPGSRQGSNAQTRDRRRPIDAAEGEHSDVKRNAGHERRARSAAGQARQPGEERNGPRQPRQNFDETTRDGVRPGKERAADEPDAPDYDEGLLPFSVRAELRSLAPETARRVGGHILAAGELLDEDPELALKHARAARRLAGRLPVVREVVAEVAYEAGEYESALTDFRALHRMNGDPNYLPVIADCERALGRHQAALRTLRQAASAQLSATQYVEAMLVEAGVRADLGQQAEATRLLKKTIESGVGSRPEQARLRFAYANQLLAAGQRDQALKWFQAAQRYDDDGVLDVASQLAALTGVELEDAGDDFEILAIELEDDEDSAPRPTRTARSQSATERKFSHEHSQRKADQ